MSNEKDRPDNVVHDNSDGNPANYKTEFGYPAEEMERLGDPIGYFRLVAFRDKDGDVGMATDQFVNDENQSDFESAVVSLLVKNPGVLAQFQKYVNRAEAFAKMRDGDFLGAMRTIMERPGRRQFAPGGSMFGDGMDAIRRLMTNDEEPRGRRRDPGGLSSLLETLGGRRRGGLEIHVVGIGSKGGAADLDGLEDIERFADLMRKARGGEGCDCPACTAERERVANEKPGTDNGAKEPADTVASNGTENPPEQ